METDTKKQHCVCENTSHSLNSSNLHTVQHTQLVYLHADPCQHHYCLWMKCAKTYGYCLTKKSTLKNITTGQSFTSKTKTVKYRAVPDFSSSSGSGRNPALFPNLAEIRLRQKSYRSRIVLPDLKSQFLDC